MNRQILDFTQSTNDIKDVKIFFGKDDGIQRYDRHRYSNTEKLLDAQVAATWFPKEINFSADRSGIKRLSEGRLQQYISNLMFQTAADSLANKFLDNLLASMITSPEWEVVIKTQAYFELLHSQAYSHNIREVFPDAEAIFNDGFATPEIQSRLDIERKFFGELSDTQDGGLGSLSIFDKKKVLIKAIVAQYILENVRFMVSFLYTFKINQLEHNAIPGSENNIKLIANDENIHCVIFASLINIIRDEEHEGFGTVFETAFEDEGGFEEYMIKRFKEVIASEMKWFKYLDHFEETEGFTEETIYDFLSHLAYKALKKIKVKDNPYNSVPNEINRFFDKRKVINDAKKLLQEDDLLSYNVASLSDLELFESEKSNKLLETVLERLSKR